MISSLYLIAHSVRGQPAFDIAELCEDMGSETDPGPWWIIPTSGHRAYPYRSWHLAELMILAECGPIPPMPDDLPDHYWHDGNDEIQAHYTQVEAALAGRSLAEKLGLAKPQAPLTRRV